MRLPLQNRAHPHASIFACCALSAAVACTSPPKAPPGSASNVKAAEAQTESEPVTRSLSAAPTASAATPEEKLSAPGHELVLDFLRSDDSAVVDRPPIHPVRTIWNREAIVPPMCYTKTEGEHNPCYVCHQDALPERVNTMNDGDLQLAYSFSEFALKNRWQNLFEDRTAKVAQISDAEIERWIEQDNYTELRERLLGENFRGYLPDLAGLAEGAHAFDQDGFAKDGSFWVAFNYKPMPSTFWPTNGATDDVMIRLPEAFRTTLAGETSREVYRANLALVEANIKGLGRISVAPLDEKALGQDLNGDGVFGLITEITRTKEYVGAAKPELKLPYLYPMNTEFLHSVRYVGVDAHGNVGPSRRLKELRYMKKRFFKSRDQLAEEYRQEGYAKEAGTLPGYVDRGDQGFDNDMGWVISGFIENAQGRLRFNSYEENLFCMGCHTSVGTTIDSVFSFARKIDGAPGWGYIKLRGMPDAPNRGESEGEIAAYLRRAGGGGEFRSNPEMEARWFTDGRTDLKKLGQARDVYDLITPSRDRAVLLNKAYRVLVSEQTFLFGRDPTVTSPPNVYATIDPKTAPTLPPERTFRWDIRLDWPKRTSETPRPEATRISASSFANPPTDN
jgi:hypothetical protein